MLRSMTGYGASEAETEEFSVRIELKAVNQRYLDIDVKMPFILNRFDDAIKKKIKERVSRGKLLAAVTFKDRREKNIAISVNATLAESYKRCLDDLSARLGLAPVKNVNDIVRLGDVITLDETAAELDGAQSVIMDALGQALDKFIAMREAEGANIATDFSLRLDNIAAAVTRLEEIAPRQVAHYRERLEKVLADLAVTGTDDAQREARIVQEVAIYADRVDYTEEFVRLKSHIAQFRQIIASDEPVGRKLDFLIQEMNREINTATSKSPDLEVASLAVSVKSEIEKLREQIQNIE